MNLLPISLGVARAAETQAKGAAKGKAKGKEGGAGTSGSASSSASSSKKIPVEVKNRVFERDGHACRFCGFVSKKYQDVHFLNRNPQDFSETNLVTACIFCNQCFNLEEVSAMKSGVLLWMPEIGQAELNHIARAIYVARISQGPMADAARKALDSIMARREEAKKRISTDNPQILAIVLRDYLGPKNYEEREKKLKGVRLFPLERRLIREADLEFNQFPQILAYWRSKDGPFGGKPPAQWISLYQQEMARAA